MRKLVLIIAVAFTSVAFAQTGVKEDIELIQSFYGKSKQELVSAYMVLKEPQLSEFTKVYEAYEQERKVLAQKRMQIISDYATNYATLDDAKADAIAKASLANNLAYEKLYAKYYGKSKKVIGALNAAKFIQLETALHTVIREETQNAIPFIGEIDRTKKM